MDFTGITESFREDFYSMVEQIPEGRVTTYGTLAEELGDQRAARAVGKMLNENPRFGIVPCHRVVRYDGSIGGFDKGEEKKKEMLRDEGIEVEKGKIVDFEKRMFTDFKGKKPLNTLREIQMEARKEVITEDRFENKQRIGGVDVSYSNGKAYPALSVWEGKEEIKCVTDEYDISFPYIPTYLSFREMPPLLKMLEKYIGDIDILFVDGNGIMHPKKIGLASHLGVEADVPTIGVAKSKLCGSVEGDVNEENRVERVKRDGEVIGYAYLSNKRAKNPIYISPGHRISMESALDTVKGYCNYKVPDPIRNAHIAATQRRKER